MPKTSVSIIYVTAASIEEARKISESLVSSGIAACANILAPIISVYKWQGELQTEEEHPLIIKTATTMVKRAIEEIKNIHSYECPCIISWEIDSGYNPFLKWIKENSLSTVG